MGDAPQDLSTEALTKRAKHDKIVKVSEEILEILVKNELNIGDVHQVLGSVQNVLDTFYKNSKMESVKNSFQK